MTTTTADHAAMKLGKLAPRHDPRTLQFANYLQPQLPPPPTAADWGAKIASWPMMANDTIGDCTCAAAGHLIEEWSTNAGHPDTPDDAEVIDAYAAITGYDPATGANDNGAVETDVLNYWRRSGIGGHTIYAYAALEPDNHDHVKDAVELFGGCYIGLALPRSAETQKVWTVPAGGPVGDGEPGSWGGHAVPVVAYDHRTLIVVTWGACKTMTWSFWRAYCDEAYAVLSPDWVKKHGPAPVGFDLAALQQDLAAVTAK